jgi:hypothetical protein
MTFKDGRIRAKCVATSIPRTQIEERRPAEPQLLR